MLGEGQDTTRKNETGEKKREEEREKRIERRGRNRKLTGWRKERANREDRGVGKGGKEERGEKRRYRKVKE